MRASGVVIACVPSGLRRQCRGWIEDVDDGLSAAGYKLTLAPPRQKSGASVSECRDVIIDIRASS